MMRHVSWMSEFTTTLAYTHWVAFATPQRLRWQVAVDNLVGLYTAYAPRTRARPCTLQGHRVRPMPCWSAARRRLGGRLRSGCTCPRPRPRGRQGPGLHPYCHNKFNMYAACSRVCGTNADQRLGSHGPVSDGRANSHTARRAAQHRHREQGTAHCR